MNFIDKHKAEPWLCYLAFNAVHAPLESTEKYLSRFSNIDDKKRRTFAAMLSAMDDAVGSVMAKLRETGQEENTLIFFISDNGGPTARPLRATARCAASRRRLGKAAFACRGPCSGRATFPAGKVDDRPVIQLDILPTALAAAGVTVQPEWKLDGVNLLPYVTGRKEGARRTRRSTGDSGSRSPSAKATGSW